MKNMNKVLLAAVVAIAFTTANYAKADWALLSPRAQANQTHTVAGSSLNDPDLVANRIAVGSPKAIEQARSLAKVSGTDPTDLAHDPTPTMSPKDPNYAQALREMREVQIAPLK